MIFLAVNALLISHGGTWILNVNTMEILELLKAPVICMIAGERKEFLSGQEAKAQIKDN